MIAGALSHRKGIVIDRSSDERTMLEESLAAWMAFDKDASKRNKIADIPVEPVKEGVSFSFKDAQGNDLRLKAELNDSNDIVFAYTDARGRKNYVQFDVSCYNVGVNMGAAKFNAPGAFEEARKEIGGQNLRMQSMSLPLTRIKRGQKLKLICKANILCCLEACLKIVQK